MVRYHLGPRRRRAPRPASGCGRCSASSPTPRSPATTGRRCPGAAAVELGHNFSLVHDDIEDGDRERRHRPTLWALHGVAQAINTGDMLFSLRRIALHRLSDLGFSDAKVLRLMRLYDETCVALCEGQYIDIATSESDELMSVELYFDMIGRKTAALIAASIEAGALLATDDDEVIARYRGVRLGARARVPAQRRPARDLGRRAGDRQGAVRHRPPQEDAAGDLRVRARRPRGPRAARRGCTATATSRTATSTEVVAILERTGARDFTRDQARRYRDEALAELDAAGVVDARGPRAARGDHRLGDQRLGSSPDVQAPGVRRSASCIEIARSASEPPRHRAAAIGVLPPALIHLEDRAAARTEMHAG